MKLIWLSCKASLQETVLSILRWIQLNFCFITECEVAWQLLKCSERTLHSWLNVVSEWSSLCQAGVCVREVVDRVHGVCEQLCGVTTADLEEAVGQLKRIAPVTQVRITLFLRYCVCVLQGEFNSYVIKDKVVFPRLQLKWVTVKLVSVFNKVTLLTDTCCLSCRGFAHVFVSVKSACFSCGQAPSSSAEAAPRFLHELWFGLQRTAGRSRSTGGRRPAQRLHAAAQPDEPLQTAARLDRRVRPDVRHLCDVTISFALAFSSQSSWGVRTGEKKLRKSWGWNTVV